MSRRSAGSILRHPAPSSDSRCAQYGPAACSVKSAIRTPCSGCRGDVLTSRASECPMASPLLDLLAFMSEPFAPDRVVVRPGLGCRARLSRRFAVELERRGKHRHATEAGHLE